MTSHACKDNERTLVENAPPSRPQDTIPAPPPFEPLVEDEEIPLFVGVTG